MSGVDAPDFPPNPPPDCRPVHRPARLLAPDAPAHGLRAAGAGTAGGDRFLDVWLYRDPPAALTEPRRWALVPAPGGRPVRVSAAAVAASPAPPHVRLTLAGAPDPGRYLLVVFPERAAEGGFPALPPIPFDPLRTRLPVRLRPECPDLGGCFPEEPAPPPRPPAPVHDYLARDWRSLRVALLEFLTRDAGPGPVDLSPADPTITVLELFAHAGDLLHYRLDRVATEAYLETARLRTSVRRHARLVDYDVAEAASATTLVLLQPDPSGGAVAAAAGDTAVAQEGDRLGFVLDEGRSAHPGLGEIAIYDWDEDGCCLPAGATECVLVRPLPTDAAGAPWLQPGDRLVFEVIDPLDRTRHHQWATRTAGVVWPAVDAAGRPAFREPLPSRAACAVTLTEVADLADPLAPAGMRLSRVRWAAADALPRDLPVTIDTGAGGDEVTVARANVVPAHHGRPVAGAGVLAPRPDGVAGEYSLLAAGVPGAAGPGVALRPDGRPHLLRVAVRLPTGTRVEADHVRSLLEVVSTGRLAYVLDVEEHEPPILRFRTGAVGLAPPLREAVAARYEIGGGTAGNIPANVLRGLERDTADPADAGAAPSWQPVAGLVARNPLPATGGRDAVELDVVRRDAPEAFAAVPRRAVTVADHAAEAARVPGVQGAVAERSWSGSWPVVRTVVDQVEDGTAGLAAIAARLDEVRMLGTEVAVTAGLPVGLFLSLRICAAPGTDPEAVRRAALTALRPGTDERPGLFHPARLSLGRPVYVSAALAAVAALPGVDAVEVSQARRLGEPAGTVHQVITVAPTEIPVLDDDPARPERGRLDITVRGGS